MLWRSFASSGYEVQNSVIIQAANPTQAANMLAPPTEQGSSTVSLIYTSYGSNVSLHFRDSTTGSTSEIALGNSSSISTWQNGKMVWNGVDLWVGSGVGPVYLRHYSLNSSTLPTSATLTSTQSYGDTDSRSGDMIRLKSGTLVLLWHQQGDTGPHGYSLVTRPISTGSWGTPMTVNFMPSSSSKQALVQNPADDSIWFFTVPDAWGRMGAAHLTETSGGLKLDWTNPYFLTVTDGINNVDPENSWIEAKPDSSTGTIVVAYTTDQRNQPYYPSSIVGTPAVSYLAFMRITAGGEKTFTQLPVWVDRLMSFGLVVRPGEVWLGYTPINIATGDMLSAQASRFNGSSWEEPIQLGTKKNPSDRIYSAFSRSDFTFNGKDNLLHLARVVPVGTSDALAPPATAITSPANGSAVSGTAIISATATDKVGITRVDFLIDGVVKTNDLTSPYSFSWNTVNYSSGTYTLSTRAYGKYGNIGNSALITVTVNNSGGTTTDTQAPNVTISTPLNNQTVSGKVAIKASGSDNVGVTKIQLLIDGALKSTVNGASISYSWGTGAKSVAKGQHTILVKAYDAKGNVGQASIVVIK